MNELPQEFGIARTTPKMSPMKRIFDFTSALLGLIVLSPIIALTALCVSISSHGPAVFRQERVGKGEQLFTCYKFRTMYPGTAQRATHEVGASAVTPIGSVLRKCKLDELPQLWNVFRGDMSLVGPRPCLPVQKELISERRTRDVFSLRPGITGLAQVDDIDMSEPKRLAERDADYITEQSLALDLSLIFRTIFRI